MKDNGVYIAVVISKRLEASLLADIPQFDGGISRGSCNQRPSNIGCNVPNSGGVTHKRVVTLSTGSVPKANRIVTGTGSDNVSFNSHKRNAFYIFLMPNELTFDGIG